jgi:hypothetical protein
MRPVVEGKKRISKLHFLRYRLGKLHVELPQRMSESEAEFGPGEAVRAG